MREVLSAELLTYLFIMCITPGPNNLTCLYLGASKGVGGVHRFLSASVLSLFIKSVICGFVNLGLAEAVPSAPGWLMWIGAAYMIYLAVNMALSGWKSEDEPTKGIAGGTFMSGVLLQLLNGKSWIAAISLYALYVIPRSREVSAIMAAAAVFAVLGYACSIVWAAGGSALKRFISRYRKPFGIIMGLSLIWCAVTAVM